MTPSSKTSASAFRRALHSVTGFLGGVEDSDSFDRQRGMDYDIDEPAYVATSNSNLDITEVIEYAKLVGTVGAQVTPYTGTVVSRASGQWAFATCQELLPELEQYREVIEADVQAGMRLEARQTGKRVESAFVLSSSIVDQRLPFGYVQLLPLFEAKALGARLRQERDHQREREARRLEEDLLQTTHLRRVGGEGPNVIPLHPEALNHVGRSEDNDDGQVLVLEVSRHHLTLQHDARLGRWIVEDHSKQGTRVDGKPLVHGEATTIDDGQTIDLASGSAIYTFHIGALSTQNTPDMLRDR